MNKFFISHIFLLLGICFSLTNISFGQSGAKKEAALRDGSLVTAAMEIDFHSMTEITSNYMQLYDCAYYKPVGICFRPFPLNIKLMHRYYVPFQLTESNVRPDATTFVDRSLMKNIAETAYQKINTELEQELKMSHELINMQQSDPKLNFSGEVNKEMLKNLRKYHAKDESFIGMSAEDAQTANYSVGSNHEWHNEMRDRDVFANPESPWAWCHDFSRNAPSGIIDPHVEIEPFTSLGVLAPTTLKKKLIPMISYFMRYSQDKSLFPDLAERTPKPGKPVSTACYSKRQKNGIGHPQFFAGKENFVVPETQQGTEQDNKVCPGFGFHGPAGPFTIFAKTYFPAGNAMMASLRGLLVAWSTMVRGAENKFTYDYTTGRHRVHSYHSEFRGYPNDHLQRIWPKPPLVGWKKGCSDTKGKGFYIPPQIRPEDNVEANVVKDENYGSHYRFAHYTSIVCCPAGWIPITGATLKEG